MQLTLLNATCVIVGSLNRMILQPPWLVEHGLIARREDGSPPPMDIVMRAGPSIHHIDADDAMWMIEPGKLQIQARAPASEVDLGAKVDSLLEILEHTPVIGVGNNFTFRADGQALMDTGEMGVVKSLKSNLPDGSLASMMFVAPSDDSRLQVTIERGPGEVLVHFNFHRDTPPDADTAHSTAKAREGARRWKADRMKAQELAQKIGTEIA